MLVAVVLIIIGMLLIFLAQNKLNSKSGWTGIGFLAFGISLLGISAAILTIQNYGGRTQMNALFSVIGLVIIFPGLWIIVFYPYVPAENNKYDRNIYRVGWTLFFLGLVIIFIPPLWIRA